MTGVIIALIVSSFVGYFIFNKYKPQPVLIAGAFVLMSCAIILDTGKILDVKQSTGFVWFDLFEFIKNTLSSRTAGLGLLIMAVGGFAKYMDHIGASRVLVSIAVKPLAKLKSPYIVLSAGYMLGQVLAIFIPSAAGLGLLLMVTMFPILLKLGVSRLSAVAIIGTTQSLDLGPASGNSMLSASNAGMDIATYFAHYQIPVALCVIATVAVLHFVVQQWFDRKAGHVMEQSDEVEIQKEENLPPMIYALLPIIPLALILVFSSLLVKQIRMDVVTAMLISVFVSMGFEYFRQRNIKKIFTDLQVFFDGMGTFFATVITLIVCGEIFAKGLVSIGAINTIIDSAQASGFGSSGMIFVMTGIIAVSAIIMGSGNAPFFAFAALAPVIAKRMAIEPILMLLPMQFAASIARSVSPITAVIVATAGIANVSPIDVVKRTAIPMAGALIVNVVACFILL
jgi:DcuC family C4-dicarboxylate transporter